MRSSTKNNQYSIPAFAPKLNQKVLTFNARSFRLRKDIESLDKVYISEAPEAVIFYCSRILEVLTKDAYKRFFGQKEDHLATCLNLLRQYNLLPETTYYWAKGLRVLGNDVRHIKRSVNMDDAELAMFFLEFILKWYFCHYSLGEKFNSYKCSMGDLSPKSKSHLVNIAWTLEQKKLDIKSIQRIVSSNKDLFKESFYKNPTLPTLLIEKFIKAGEYGEVEKIFKSISSSLKDRLLELKSLFFSRTKKYDGALEILSGEYYEKYKYSPSRIDDDWIGILGGVYKNIWEETGDLNCLKKSYETYKLGWDGRRTKKENCYLGINTAATALMLGDVSKYQRIARDTINCLVGRQGTIKERTGQENALDYWDTVTLAEAYLLMSETEQANKLYTFAFEKYSDLSENIKITKKQRDKILEKLGIIPS